MSQNDSRNQEILQAWAKLYHIKFNGTRPAKSSGVKGSGLFATKAISEPGSVLIKVPRDLILSLENVWVCAKSDLHLREMLEACGDFSRVK